MYGVLLRTKYRLTREDFKGIFFKIMEKRVYRSIFIHQNCNILKFSENLATIISVPSMKITSKTITSLIDSNFSVFPISRIVTGFMNTEEIVERFVSALQNDCEYDFD